MIDSAQVADLISQKFGVSPCALALFASPPLWFSEVDNKSRTSWPSYIVAKENEGIFDIIGDFGLSENIQVFALRGGVFIFDFFADDELGQTYDVRGKTEDYFLSAGLSARRDPLDIERSRLMIINAFQVLLHKDHLPLPEMASSITVGHLFDLDTINLPLSIRASPIHEPPQEGNGRFSEDTQLRVRTH